MKIEREERIQESKGSMVGRHDITVTSILSGKTFLLLQGVQYLIDVGKLERNARSVAKVLIANSDISIKSDKIMTLVLVTNDFER